MVLSALPGVGERLAKKMTDHFGSEEAALSSLKSGDIGQIAEIEGVSPKRALALARSIAGDDGQFLAVGSSHNQLNSQEDEGFSAGYLGYEDDPGNVGVYKLILMHRLHYLQQLQQDMTQRQLLQELQKPEVL